MRTPMHAATYDDLIRQAAGGVFCDATSIEYIRRSEATALIGLTFGKDKRQVAADIHANIHARTL